MPPNLIENNPKIGGLNNNMEENRFDSLPPVKVVSAESSSPAVEVVNACKSYNGVPVLKNFDMTVEQGTIYSLLGASGCGKTTILSCIVGIKKIETGDIFVFGERPGTKESGIPGRRLGYMPQDIALYKHLSIKEMLQYIGRIYAMTNSEIMSRIEFLSHFLDLPPSSRRIADLSGGQQRRTSLAVSLIHSPPLLILDEPTVGVDPLLRESIWTHLCDLVAKKSTTIIITTHYIEEARQSNKVGLMRNGRLLVENSPQRLLKENHAVLLEDIVLKLCKLDKGGFGESHHEEVRQTIAENSFYSRRKAAIAPPVVGLKFTQTSELSSDLGIQNKHMKLHRKRSIREQATQGIWGKFSRIRALAVRNFLTLLRTPIFMLAIFFMPSFQVIITNLTLGPEPKHLAFGIVDPEINFDLARCDIPEVKKCGVEALSCQYIKTLPNNIIDPIAVATAEQALYDVQIGKLWGYMEFPANYSQNLVNRGLEGIWADNATLDHSTISLRMDYSHYFAAALLTKSLYESFQVFAKKTLAGCEQDPRKAEIGMVFRKPIYGEEELTFTTYIGPAVLVVILFFIPFLSCAVYNITDRKQGTLDRSMVAGITMTDLLSAFFCTEGFLILIQTMVAYLLILFIFEMEIKGSVFGVLLIIVMTGVAGLSLGFLIAQLVDEEVEALILGVGFYLPNLIFCGIIWPLEAAPIYIRLISYCLPMTWAIGAVRSLISRGWSMSHPYVLPGYLVLLTWILSCWILSFLAFKRKSR